MYLYVPIFGMVFTWYKSMCKIIKVYFGLFDNLYIFFVSASNEAMFC